LRCILAVNSPLRVRRRLDNEPENAKVVARGHPRGFALPIDLTGMAVCRTVSRALVRRAAAFDRRVTSPSHRSSTPLPAVAYGQ
jgi:hypothetical protein